MAAHTAGSPTLHERLVDEYAALIARGTLAPGDRLPSVRRLAVERNVSQAAALQALRALESRGLLESRPQSGYFVRRRARRPEEPFAASAPDGPRELAT